VTNSSPGALLSNGKRHERGAGEFVQLPRQPCAALFLAARAPPPCPRPLPRRPTAAPPAPCLTILATALAPHALATVSLITFQLFSFSAETRLLRILSVTPEKLLALLLLLLLALLVLLLASARLLLPAPLLLLETPKLALALALSAQVGCRALGPLAVAPVPPASLGTLSPLRTPFLLSSVTLGSLVVSGRLAAVIGPRPRLLLLVAALPAAACPRARARARRAAPRPLGFRV